MIIVYIDRVIEMVKKKVQMPAGTAGLVRYFDEYKEAIQIKPEHVVIVTAAIIVIEILLRFM